MKLAVSVLLFVACLSGSAVSTVLFIIPQRQSSTPDLEVLPGPMQDLGLLRQGTDATVRFDLINHSDQMIHIRDISVGCDCANYAISTRDIQPSGHAVLTMTYHTGSRRGEVNAGAAVAYQRTDEPDTHLLRLKISAHIDPEFDVEPDSLLFSISNELVQRVKLRPRHASHVHVLSANVDKRFFTTRLVTSVETKTPEIEVLLNPKTYYPGAGPASLFVYTDCAQQPIVKLPIHVRYTARN